MEGNPLDQKMLAEELESVMEEDLKNLREIGLDLQQVRLNLDLLERCFHLPRRLKNTCRHSNHISPIPPYFAVSYKYDT